MREEASISSSYTQRATVAHPMSDQAAIPELAPDEPGAMPAAGPEGRCVALAMSGGGARAAYQMGVLRGVMRAHPEFAPTILTGVSAGAINAGYLANHNGSFTEAVSGLGRLWRQLRTEHVFNVTGPSVAKTSLTWARRLLSGGSKSSRNAQALLDATPLRELLEREMVNHGGLVTGIDTNIAAGRLDAVAITSSSYTTGQSVTWVQGRDVEGWDRPNRRAVQTRIGPEHVLASASLPFFFPAVKVNHPAIGEGWYGDGGIRLTAPLSPALHLGARKILAVSTRYGRTAAEADKPAIDDYPPPAQILGVLMNAIFLDLLDQDAQVLRRINKLLEAWPDGKPGPDPHAGFRPVKLLVLRPSQDLAKLASEFETNLPPTFRFLMRGLGVRETRSPDWLSMLLFEPEYIGLLTEIGEADAAARADEVIEFLEADECQAERAAGVQKIL